MVFYWTWFWFVGLIPKYEVDEVGMAYSPSDYLTRLCHIHDLGMPANNHNRSPEVLCMLPTVRMIPSGLIRYTLMPCLLIPQKISPNTCCGSILRLFSTGKSHTNLLTFGCNPGSELFHYTLCSSLW